MKPIHLSRADITEVEEDYVLAAVRSGWVAPLGPMVDQFEAKIAERVGVADALALSSGTAALHLALLHLGARPGSVVILPTMTFAASANAVLYTGAEPVFVDSCESDGNLDVDLTLQAIDTLRSESRTISCVMAVDLYGRCAHYGRLVPELADRGIPLLEDAAEALGASHNGASAGSFGQAAALSFNGNKIMTTSGGGMLVSNNAELIERARYLSAQARQPSPWYEHTEMGFNYRMSNILAALGVAQLSRLDDMIAKRRSHRERYVQALSDLSDLRFLGRAGEDGDAYDNCWLTSIVIGGSAMPDVSDVIRQLEAEQIEARHLWKPMHLQPMFADARTFGGRSASRLFEQGINLPSGSELEPSDIDRVADALIGSLTSKAQRR